MAPRKQILAKDLFAKAQAHGYNPRAYEDKDRLRVVKRYGKKSIINQQRVIQYFTWCVPKVVGYSYSTPLMTAPSVVSLVTSRFLPTSFSSYCAVLLPMQFFHFHSLNDIEDHNAVSAILSAPALTSGQEMLMGFARGVGKGEGKRPAAESLGCGVISVFHSFATFVTADE